MTVKCISWEICPYDCPHKVDHDKNERCLICEPVILLDKNTELPCEKKEVTYGD